MASDYTVGDLVAEFLASCGVETVFGIASVHNIPMLDGIGRRNAIRYMMARGEMGGVHMADGYARASGQLGVFFSSTGPGAANAVGGLVEAQFAGSPVLHITGQTATKFVDKELGTVHDVPDQQGMLAAVSKTTYRVRQANQALGVLTRAAVDALTPPRGPVSVEVPIDIQRTKIERPAMLDNFSLPLPPALVPSEAALDELASRVLSAKRPMLWLGTGAAGAGGPAARLLDMGFGMVSSWKGRGAVSEDHPMNLGGLHGNGMPVITDFWDTVDLLLVVGARVRGQETGDFSLKLPDNLIQVDIDPLANGRTYANKYFVSGDSKLVLDGLLKRIQGKTRFDTAFSADFRKMKQTAQAEFLATLGPYGSFSAQLRAVLPRNALWVRDVTQNNTTWGNRLFPIHDTTSNIYPVGAGIGQGMPLGIGAAAAAKGRKTIAMVGDGGFFLNVGELWTAVQENLDIVILVMNDQGYGVIKRIQDSLQGGRRFFADLQGPDLGELAGIAKIPFFKCTTAETFGSTVAEALQVNGPCLVEVDMSEVGEFPPYYPFNIRPQG
jgi:acetolactate synthase-1/2/3 large subunit